MTTFSCPDCTDGQRPERRIRERRAGTEPMKRVAQSRTSAPDWTSKPRSTIATRIGMVTALLVAAALGYAGGRASVPIPVPGGLGASSAHLAVLSPAVAPAAHDVPAPTLGPGPVTSAPEVSERGRLNQADPSHGSRYLAVRAPRGTWIRVCAKRCVVMASTDYGPEAGTGKVADVALVVWRFVCQRADSRGTCPGSITWPVEAPTPSLPATDVEP